MDLEKLKEALKMLLECIEKAEQQHQPSGDIIDKGRKYKISGTCKTCGGNVSWDEYNKETHPYPTHVDNDGYLFNDGNCPKFKSMRYGG